MRKSWNEEFRYCNTYMVPCCQINGFPYHWPGYFLLRLNFVLLNPFPVFTIQVYYHPGDDAYEVKWNWCYYGKERWGNIGLISERREIKHELNHKKWNETFSCNLFKFFRFPDKEQHATIEFSLNVFTEFAEFIDKNICHYCKRAQTCNPGTSCVRHQHATTAPARHMWETGSLNWAQFMVQCFISIPEFCEFLLHLGKTPIFCKGRSRIPKC